VRRQAAHRPRRGRNNETDLALIKIEPSHPLAIMPLGTAIDLMLGETVVAIGNASATKTPSAWG